jgi:hypothetical protein
MSDWAASGSGGIFQLPIDTGGGTPSNYWDQFNNGADSPNYGRDQNQYGGYTDPATGAMYDSNGNPLGTLDPNYNAAAQQPTGPPAPGTTEPGSSSIDPSSLASLMKMLGGVPGIAGILGPLLGGIYANHATSQATSQVLGGIQNANDQIKSILGGQSPYSPYMNAGNQALQNASNTQWKPLNFGPLGQTPVGPARITNTNPITSLGALAGRR